MFHQKVFRGVGFTLTGLLMAAAALAQPLQASDAWARATVPGQKTGSVFMALHSETGATITVGSSPAAKTVELHKMDMQDDVMRMRQIQSVAVPAGQTVQLTPGGTHIMLMGLRQPLTEGSTIELTLDVQDQNGDASTVPVQVQVRGVAAGAGNHADHMRHHDMNHDGQGMEHQGHGMSHHHGG